MKRAITVAGALLGGAVIYAVALGVDADARSSAPGPRRTDASAAPREAVDLVPALVPAPGIEAATLETHAAGLVQTSEERAGSDTVPEASRLVPLGGLVFGRVLDEDGDPIEGDAYVTFYDPDGERLQVKADAQGRYSMSGLGAGRWRLIGSAWRHWRTGEYVDLASGQDPLRQDFRLERAPVVQVRVTGPDGAPIHEALREAGLSSSELLPVATAEAPGAVFSEVVGSYNNGFGVGSFWQSGFNGERLPPEYLGVLVLNQELPAHVSLVNYHGVLATQFVAAGADEAAFVLDPETLRSSLAGLRVCLVDAGSGDPLQGNIDLNDQRSWGPGVSLDDAGAALFEGKPPGRYTLSFRAPGLERVQEAVELQAGHILDLGTLALEPGRTLVARVLDPEGQPATVAFELGEQTGDPRAVRFDWTHEYSSDGGELRIEGLSAGDFVLRSAGDEDDRFAAHTVEFSTRAGSVEDLVIRLVPAVRLSVQPSDIRLDEECWRFRLFDDAGHCVSSGLVSIWGRHLSLVPGDYELAVEGPGGESSSRRLDLSEPTTVTVP